MEPYGAGPQRLSHSFNAIWERTSGILFEADVILTGCRVNAGLLIRFLLHRRRYNVHKEEVSSTSNSVRRC